MERPISSFEVLKRWYFRARPWLLPVMLLLIVALPQLDGGRVRIDTGLYGGLSLRAYAEGHWWTLMAGDVPYFKKPPLTFWLYGVPLIALDNVLWVILLTNTVAAVACLLVVVSLVRRLSTWRVAMVAGMMFVLYDGYLRYIKRFILDYWHTCLILLGVYLVVCGVMRWRRCVPGGRHGLWPVALVVASGVPIGLAMLVKPLVALLGLPIVGMWMIWMGMGRRVVWLIPAMLVAIAIMLPWHLSMYLTHGERFLNEYFGRQILARSTGEAFDSEPWWWYVVHLATHFQPWFLLAIVGFWRWWRHRGEGMRDHEALMRLSVVWCVIWLVLASGFADKRDRYILHLTPLLAGVAAHFVLTIVPVAWQRRHRLAPDVALSIGLVISVTVLILPITFSRAEDPAWERLYQFIREHPDGTYVRGTVRYVDGGRLYFYTGVWPDDPWASSGEATMPAPGALVLFDTEFAPAPPAHWMPLFHEMRADGTALEVRRTSGVPSFGGFFSGTR